MAAPDNFEDLECIGRGGFGEVYRCRRLSDGRVFARKRILAFARIVSASDEVRRFVREVRLLSRLRHPNINPDHRGQYDHAAVLVCDAAL